MTIILNSHRHEIYKNNHTTSTKSQYHAAASTPKWWMLLGQKENLEMWIKLNRITQNNIKLYKINMRKKKRFDI